MLVMKFGGTSVQDASSMHNVASIIRQYSNQSLVLVISAIAQGTNLLTAIGKDAARGEKELVETSITTFINKHLHIVEEGLTTPERKKFLVEKIISVEKELRRISEGVFLLRELSPRSQDALCVFGEYISSLCINEIFQEQGIESEWLDARTFITTDDNFTAATPHMEISEQKLKTILRKKKKDGRIFVTQGFIGATEEGLSTTMGRESSDYSAAVIGALVHAEEIQIWTDVDGIFTTDPKAVKKVKLIPLVSYVEALELAERGAKVLHPKTMLPAMQNKIPIRILNSKNISSKGSIVSFIEDTSNVPVSFAVKNNVALVFLIPKERKNYSMFSEIVTGILTKNKITPLVQVGDERSMAFILVNNNLTALLSDLSELGTVEVQEKKSLISLVGKNILTDASILLKFVQILTSTSVNFIVSGSSQLSIGGVVDEKEVPVLVEKIHREFFE